MADLFRIGVSMKKASWHFLKLENATSPIRNFQQNREGFACFPLMRRLKLDSGIGARRPAVAGTYSRVLVILVFRSAHAPDDSNLNI